MKKLYFIKLTVYIRCAYTADIDQCARQLLHSQQQKLPKTEHIHNTMTHLLLIQTKQQPSNRLTKAGQFSRTALRAILSKSRNLVFRTCFDAWWCFTRQLSDSDLIFIDWSSRSSPSCVTRRKGDTTSALVSRECPTFVEKGNQRKWAIALSIHLLSVHWIYK